MNKQPNMASALFPPFISASYQNKQNKLDWTVQGLITRFTLTNTTTALDGARSELRHSILLTLSIWISK